MNDIKVLGFGMMGHPDYVACTSFFVRLLIFLCVRCSLRGLSANSVYALVIKVCIITVVNSVIAGTISSSLAVYAQQYKARPLDAR
jgi:hypothetical protein